MKHKAEMEQYIDQVHREPFSLLHNNCFHQVLRLVKKARSLGIQANMVICISKAPKKLWGFIPIVSSHAYAIIDGVKVDVALSPEQEKKYWKNTERRIYLPIKIRC